MPGDPIVHSEREPDEPEGPIQESGAPEGPIQPTRQRRIIASRRFRGPLPLAAEFGEYERHFPGAADRILAMAEKQLDQSHEYQMQVVADRAQANRLRTWIVGIIAAIAVPTVLIAGLALGGFLVWIGQAITGLFTLVTEIVGLVILSIGIWRARNGNGARELLDRILTDLSEPDDEDDE